MDGPARRVTRGQRGQSSVEYALVLLAFLSVVVGMASVWQAARAGRLSRLAREASSHNRDSGVTVGLVQDVAAY